MSYDIRFKVKVEGTDCYIPIEFLDYSPNITWNVREIITKSTGLEWKNEENNGLVKDVIPYIEKGLSELMKNGKNYKKYEPGNGWGSVEDTIRFFSYILECWYEFICWHEELVDVVTFWIE